MLFGSGFILVFLGVSGNIGGILTLVPTQWLWSIIPAITLTIYLLTWYKGLEDIPATLATSILLLGSPITTLLNIVFTGATLTINQAAGIVILVVGIVLFLYASEDFSLKQPIYIDG
jgi:drug/metabolite transporter (DMT)-like permease